MFRVNQELWAIFLNSCEDFKKLQRAILSGDIRHMDTILVTVQGEDLQLDSPRSRTLPTRRLSELEKWFLKLITRCWVKKSLQRLHMQYQSPVIRFFVLDVEVVNLLQQHTYEKVRGSVKIEIYSSCTTTLSLTRKTIQKLAATMQHRSHNMKNNSHKDNRHS